MTDFEDLRKTYERHLQAVTRANKHNKEVLFDALSAASITSVTVLFDGEGDSGQIHTVDAFNDYNRIDLPDTTVALQEAVWRIEDLRLSVRTISEAIEVLCYACLELEHGGWENNDGAYGEFAFDVAARTITLEFNGRYTDVFTETHTF